MICLLAFFALFGASQAHLSHTCEDTSSNCLKLQGGSCWPKDDPACNECTCDSRKCFGAFTFNRPQSGGYGGYGLEVSEVSPLDDVLVDTLEEAAPEPVLRKINVLELTRAAHGDNPLTMGEKQEIYQEDEARDAWRSEALQTTSALQTKYTDGYFELMIQFVQSVSKKELKHSNEWLGWITSCVVDIFAALLPGPVRIVLDVLQVIADIFLFFLAASGANGNRQMPGFNEAVPMGSREGVLCTIAELLSDIFDKYQKYIQGNPTTGATWKYTGKSARAEYIDSAMKLVRTFDGATEYQKKTKVKASRKTAFKLALRKLASSTTHAFKLACPTCSPCLLPGGKKCTMKYLMGTCMKTFCKHMLQAAFKSILEFFTASVTPAELAASAAAKIASTLVPGGMLLRMFGPCLIYLTKIVAAQCANELADRYYASASLYNTIRRQYGGTSTCEYFLYDYAAGGDVTCKRYPYGGELGALWEGLREDALYGSGISSGSIRNFFTSNDSRAEKWIGKYKKMRNCLDPNTPARGTPRHVNMGWYSAVVYDCNRWSKLETVQTEAGHFSAWRTEGWSICGILNKAREAVGCTPISPRFPGGC